MKAISVRIDQFNEVVGRAVSYLVFFMIGTIIFEIVARGLFNSPTRWAHDVSGWLQVFYVFLGGAWALRSGYFVRVDIFYQAFNPRFQAAIDLTVSTVLMGVFCYVMTVEGWGFAVKSFVNNEVSSNAAWDGPVWPSKIIIPIGMCLIALSWISHCVQATIRLIDPTAAKPISKV